MMSLWKRITGQSSDEEELLQRAMGHLYFNQRARELIRSRLGRRDITQMDEGELFDLVASIIKDVRLDRSLA
jgi:hypothetical protein